MKIVSRITPPVLMQAPDSLTVRQVIGSDGHRYNLEPNSAGRLPVPPAAVEAAKAAGWTEVIQSQTTPAATPPVKPEPDAPAATEPSDPTANLPVPPSPIPEPLKGRKEPAK